MHSDNPELKKLIKELEEKNKKIRTKNKHYAEELIEELNEK